MSFREAFPILAVDDVDRAADFYCASSDSRRRSRSRMPAPTAVRREGADGADAELALHNLTCTILADSPTGEAKIDKLEAAFAELERTTRP